MTQKEKLMKAAIMAQRIKNVSNRLKFDANDYGVQFPLEYAKELEEMANDFLNFK